MANIYYCSKFRERERDPVGRGKGGSTRMLGRGKGGVQSRLNQIM